MSIEAMKQVLVFLEHLTTHSWTLQDQNKAIELQRQAIEQAQKQEPVAWWCCIPGQDAVLLFDEPRDEQYPPGYKEPLYTLPPPRQPWVGLTNEDKQIAFDDTQEGGGFWEFADAIEATLRKKNHG